MSGSLDTDLAIVGLAGRFPGAGDIDQFWRNLEAGRESIERLSEEDLRDAGVPEPLWRRADYVRAAPVLAGPADFDAEFFGYTPGEAAALDPQHRLLLELAQTALDDAGIDPSRTAGRIAVFAGAAMNTYFVDRAAATELATSYIPTLVASDKDFLATRLSYKLGLKGPSLTVQTACSTSLVAVHLARQSLLTEECDVALAAAAAVRFPHRAGYLYDGSGVVSATGRVRAFGAGADGTVFGSGGAVVVLKRLADALANGDRIYAVIKGSAVNNDGEAKAGYTAPSVDGQADVVTEALANAGLGAGDISYLEAHGSGTPVGDRIEVAALTKAFRRFTQQRGFCALGSVKSNLGHLDVAAGLAGLIKTALALHHERIPASLHADRSNPEIDFENSPFFVATGAIPWPRGEQPRRAGVMATGMGGTNAHVVLEEAPAAEPKPRGENEAQLIVLSAATEPALPALAARLRQWAETDGGGASLASVARTCGTGRRQYSFRRAAVARSLSEAATELDRGSISGRAALEGPPPVAYLLPGVGDQYPGMGRGLYARFAVYREEIDRCAELLRPLIGCDVRSVLFPEISAGDSPPRPTIDLKQLLQRGDTTRSSRQQPIDRTLFAQTSLFVTEYAAARLWMAVGVPPSRLVSHSLGEWTAACLAGVFALPDALRLVAARGQAAERLPGAAMTAVMLGEAELARLLGPELAIALINGPALCVVAGPAEAMERLHGRLKDRGAVYRAVRNGHAFHTAQMRPIAAALREELRRTSLSAPKIPFLSSLSGDWIRPSQATDPDYWVEQTCSAARFGAGLERLWQLPEQVLLEVGPGRTLGALAAQHPSRPPRPPRLVHSLRPEYENRDDAVTWLEAAGRLWTQGVPVALDRIQDRSEPVASLPAYPFQRRRHWLERKAPPATETAEGGGWIPLWVSEPLPRGTPSQAAEPCTVLPFDGKADSLFELADRVRSLAPRTGSARVAIVTRRAREASGEDFSDPLGAMASGAALALAREYPGLTICSIDADESAHPETLQADARTAGPGDVIVHRGHRRWVRRFRPVELKAAAALNLPSGTYVVTGGSRGIGQELARFLAQAAGARLALIARRLPSPDWLTAFRAEVEGHGGKVEAWAADVADPAALRSVLGEARRHFGPIRGVVHAAGLRADRSFELKTREEMAAVLAPKVAGTMNLFEAVAGDPLEFFFACSSVSSLIGYHGQVDYAAANAYLDAFAESAGRRACFPVQVVNWPVWRDVGMAAGTPLAANGISTADGIAFFRQVIHSRRAQVAYLPRGWAAPQEEAARNAVAQETAIPPIGLPETAGASSPEDVAGAISRLWRQALGRERIGTAEDFISAGGHSLLAMRIVSEIRAAYAIDFGLRDFFAAPTIAGNAAAVQEAILEEIQRLEPDRV